MGMNQDLALEGNEFSNTATFFFVAYLIAELPTGEITICNDWKNAKLIISLFALLSFYVD